MRFKAAQLFDEGKSKRQRYSSLVVGQPGLWPLIKHEIVMLLGRVSETFATPSRAGLVKQAWDARGLRIRILKEARAAEKIREITALGRALIGCERLRSSLLRSRVFLSEGHHAR